MKTIIILISLIIVFWGCKNNSNLKEISKPRQNNDTLFYFGLFNSENNTYERFDTFPFQRRILNDSILMFSYGKTDNNSFHLLDGIQFKIRNGEIVGISNQYLKETIVDTIHIVNGLGKEINLLECQIKDKTDSEGIHVISLEYGLLFAYSRSKFIYQLINTSNKEINQEILMIQNLYLMNRLEY